VARKIRPKGEAPTPRLSAHAKLRCLQMNVTTKRVKRVVRTADILYPGHPSADGSPAWLAMSECDREIAVVFVRDAAGVPVVLTVLYRGREFVRPEDE
jgi:hypothetical protein